ncbi:hypothetical protein [Microbispora bryophytorum]|uniref:hypothetical protein n=1 Tax=Microbispora bryophytorum TaxID=1460882 RepID=UPI00371C90EF
MSAIRVFSLGATTDMRSRSRRLDRGACRRGRGRGWAMPITLVLPGWLGEGDIGARIARLPAIRRIQGSMALEA